MTVDRPRVARALRALDALILANPRLRSPAARRRLAGALASLGTNAQTSDPPDAPTGRQGQGIDIP